MPALDLPSVVHQYGALSPIPALALGPRTSANDLELVRSQAALAAHLLPPSSSDDGDNTDAEVGPLRRWPPASDYRRAFWRAIVDRLEHGLAHPEAVEDELEVDERIYSAYLSTLQSSSSSSSNVGTTPFGGSAPPTSSFKTFFFPRARWSDIAQRSSSAGLPPSSIAALELQPPDTSSSPSTAANAEITLHPLHVTLAEEQKTISHGTTGLRTWGASLRLAELVLDRPDVVFPPLPPLPSTRQEQEGRQPAKTFNVLELGAGVGFLGLFLAKLGRDVALLDQRSTPTSSAAGSFPAPPALISASIPAPALRMTLTDFDERVLDRLRHNVHLNGFTPAEVDVVALDWEDSLPPASSTSTPSAADGDGPLTAQGLPRGIRRRPDLIVAADVVYDPSIIRPLVAILHRLLSATDDDDKGRTRSALVASTIRNETTFGRFLAEAEAHGLRATELTDTTSVPRVFFGAEEGGGLESGFGEVRIVRFTIG